MGGFLQVVEIHFGGFATNKAALFKFLCDKRPFRSLGISKCIFSTTLNK